MPDRGLLGWLLIGLVAGVLAKLITPGRQPSGCLVTIVIGIAGAWLAGWIAEWMHWTIRGGLYNYAAATAGAVLLLSIYHLAFGRRRY